MDRQLLISLVSRSSVIFTTVFVNVIEPDVLYEVLRYAFNLKSRRGGGYGGDASLSLPAPESTPMGSEQLHRHTWNVA